MQRRVFTLANYKPALSREKTYLSAQIKVLDVLKCSLSLYELCEPRRDAEVLDMIKSAIRLWAEAFHGLTRTRRSNILRQVNARFLGLLNAPENFSAVEANKLFDRRFLRLLACEAEDDERIQSTTQTRSFGSGRGRTTIRDRRAGPQQATSNLRGRLVQPPLSLCNISESNTGAGGNPLKISAWLSITNESWILETVAKAIKLEFLSEPVQDRAPPEYSYLQSSLRSVKVRLTLLGQKERLREQI